MLEAIKARFSCLHVATGAETSDNDVPASLSTLRPRYDAKEHSRYVKRLLCAVCEDGCNNVALSGSYGSGKSSIVEEFAKEASARGRRIAMVSLETLSLNEYTRDAESQPQGKQGDYGHGSNLPPLQDDALTAALEREILGQLLYQGDQKKASCSAFNRPRSLPVSQRIVSAIVFGLALSLVVLVVLFCADNGADKLASWRAAVGSVISGSDPLVAAIFVVFFFTVFFLSFWAIGHLPRGLRVSSVGAAGASLTLAEGERSYFDKYRDELIYLFESNRFDVVVFEDIDRFNDHRIFVELRNLNFVLNHAPGIIGGRFGNKVCFIYAVKDSLFESLSGEDDLSVVDGSGRAKLFDQIISVIPFMSELSAYDWAVKLFAAERASLEGSNDKKRFDDLLRLAVPQIADMRLLTSIRNDYLVMCEELGCIGSGSDASSLGLTPTGVLAMSIYKNIYPAEFEKLRLGKGSLNDLYLRFSSLKTAWLVSTRAALNLARGFSEGEQASVDFAGQMGALLKEALRSVTTDMRCVTVSSVDYFVEENAPRGISSPEFWTAFFCLGSDDAVVVSKDGSGYLRGGFTFTKSQFIRLFLPVLEGMGYPSMLELSDGSLSVKDYEKKITQLRGADFEDLLDVADWDESGRPFRTIIEEIMKSGLGCDLVMGGFIRSDFDLYISKYPDDARANVINFIRHHYQANLQDIDYPLDADDCCEVLRHIPASHLSRPCCFNIDLLCYLLDAHDSLIGAREMVHGACTHFGEGGKVLLDGSFQRVDAHSVQASGLVTLVTESHIGAFDYLSGVCASLYSKQGSLEIAKLSFGAFNEKLDYSCKSCKSWIQGAVDKLDFPVLSTGAEWDGAVARLLKKATASIPSLTQLGRGLGSKLVELEHFDLNRANLVFASGGERLPSLDALYKNCPHAFNMVVASNEALKDYVGFLVEGEAALVGLDAEMLQSLAGAFDLWSNDEALREVVSALVSRALLEVKVVDVKAEILAPLENNQYFCGAFVRALLSNDFILRNLANAVALAKMSAHSELDGADRAFAEFVSGGVFEMEDDDGIDKEGVKVLVNELLMVRKVSDRVVSNIIAGLHKAYVGFFPVDVSSIDSSALTASAECLKELCELEAVCPYEHVYSLMAGSKWSYRESVLLKWDGGQSRSWNIRFPLLAEDISHVILSRRLKNSWLQENVMDYWHEYLDNACPDSKDKERIEKIIASSIERRRN